MIHENIQYYFHPFYSSIFTSCGKGGDARGGPSALIDFDYSSIGFPDGRGSSGGNGGESGLVAAAAWSDLENYDFFNDRDPIQ